MSDRTIGNYILGPLLGRGGMSEVYAAEHRFLGDRVAIKLLRTQLADDPAAIARFLAEATQTRAIAHANVVRVIDFGSDGDDCYLVMERVDGETLGARLEREHRLDELEVRRLGAAIADGVAAAHDRGIVHRDLKPGNIMLAGDALKIVDFGIARAFGGGAAAVTGTRIGSLGYMAPEQITEGLIAPCIDIWALGVILYEAVSGRLPFVDFSNGRTPQLFEQAPPLRTLTPVSPALDALIAACLARVPAGRPSGMRELAAQLRGTGELRLTEPLSPAIGIGRAPPAVTTQQVVRGGARRGWRISALVAASLIAAAWAIARGMASPEPVGAATRPRPEVVATPSAATPAATPPSAVAPSAITPAAPSPAAPSATPSAATAPAPGVAPPSGFTVEIRSAPSGASVIVDGKRVGTTPATIALDVPASILVVRDGYRPSRIRAERAGPITVRLVQTARAPAPRPTTGETLD